MLDVYSDDYGDIGVVMSEVIYVCGGNVVMCVVMSEVMFVVMTEKILVNEVVVCYVM